MFYINSSCPICDYGSIGFRKCANSSTVVLLCDECDSVWLDPTDVNPKKVIYPKAPDFIVPGLDCSILAPHSRWADKDEIIEKGWTKFIAGEF